MRVPGFAIRRARRSALLVTVLLLLTWVGGHPQGSVISSQNAASAVAPRPHLLLVHGYTDSCEGAFGQDGSFWFTDADGAEVYRTEAADTSTLDYLTATSSPWKRGDITTVGYYTHDYSAPADFGGDTATNSDGSGVCDMDLNTLPSGSPAAADAAKCDSYDGKAADHGTLDDPILRLGCLLSWYIYDTYTVNGIPVEIVAHSMGGLIVRSAIGGANPSLASYPPAPLLVTRVVTVATPHGGVSPTEALAGWAAGQGSQQLTDMKEGSAFMYWMGETAFEDPQGSGGTHWALMGSSVPSGAPDATTFDGCTAGVAPSPDVSLALAVSCTMASSDGVRYSDTDGVVNSLSQLAMKADYKILYGAVEDWSNVAETLYVADTRPSSKPSSTEYEHETRTCARWYTSDGDGTMCVAEPFYLNDGTDAPGAATAMAWVCTSACATTADFGDVHLTSPVPAPHSLAAIADQLVPPATTASWVVGHAKHAGDDYPYETLGEFEHTEGVDAWNEDYGQCDSFAAWKAYENLAGSAAQSPTASVPAAGWKPGNASRSSVNQVTWGNADMWASKWAAAGYAVDNVPTPGAIAWWPNAVADPIDGHTPDSVHGIGNTGHVGYVTDVYPDGSILVEQYNMRLNGEYSLVHLTYGSSYSDNSFNLATYSAPWPGGFIHVADGDDGNGGADSPREPAGPGVVTAGYPARAAAGLLVSGPGDTAGDFTLSGSAYPGSTNGWYTSAGHGENGREQWTNSHAGAADSTATWSPVGGVPNQCYETDVFVPDTYSNNTAALYRVADQHFHTSLVPVNENDTTNDWVELGVFQADSGSGTIQVTLTDQGQKGGYVAADAVRLIRQPDCSGLKRTGQTIGGSDVVLGGASLAGTVNGWYPDSGYGQLGTSYYTFTNGMTYSSYAEWNASLVPNSCYEVYAYVPAHRATDYEAVYTIAAGSGVPRVTLDQNAYGDAFEPLGTYRTGSGGGMTVLLTDQSTVSGDSDVAADTMSFVQTACAAPGTATPVPVQGSVYPALTQGPGSPLNQFSVKSDWYNRFGHGDLGYEKWTFDNGATVGSTATWTFSGLAANTGYTVCTYVPDNFANNTAAHYQGYSGSNTTPAFTAYINQNSSYGWVYTGVVSSTGTGTAHVTLDDTGPTTVGGGPGYTAADAMKLVTGGAC